MQKKLEELQPILEEKNTQNKIMLINLQQKQAEVNILNRQTNKKKFVQRTNKLPINKGRKLII